MGNATGHENEMTVGVDVGDRYVHACFLDHDGDMMKVLDPEDKIAENHEYK